LPKLYVFDLDGTLYRGAEAIPGAASAVRELLRRGAMVRYLTNNSSLRVETQSAKLEKMGFPAPPEWITTSSMGAAGFLRGKVRSAVIVGHEGIRKPLAEVGIEEGDGEAVVVGIDREISYSKLDRALQTLLNPDSFFVATNRDATYPMEGSRLAPGAGTVVAALEACSGRKATVVGKPEPFLVEMILQETGIQPADTLIVGDRYETDIEAGIRAGCPVMMVLSGVSENAPEGGPVCPDVTSLVS
jgi:4-nitrophenyl phosphatase